MGFLSLLNTRNFGDCSGQPGAKSIWSSGFRFLQNDMYHLALCSSCFPFVRLQRSINDVCLHSSPIQLEIMTKYALSSL